MEAPTFTFRPMRRDDLPRLVAWQHSPAARRWFPQLSIAEAAERFGPRIDDPSGVRMLVAHLGGCDVGFADVFRIRDLPPGGVIPADVDDVGIDFCLGEPGLLGRGLGTRLVAQLCELARWVFPEATGIVACPNHLNTASIRVLERNGFEAGLWFDAPRLDGQPETLVAHRLARLRPLPTQ